MQRFRRAHYTLASASSRPGEAGKLIADETEKWAKVIRAANIKPD